MYTHAKEDKMKKLHFYMLTILLLTSYSLIGQSFESNATINDEFCGSSVIVIMNQQNGGINKEHEISSF